MQFRASRLSSPSAGLRKLSGAIAFVLTVPVAWSLAAEGSSKPSPVSAKVQVKAGPEAVIDAIHHLRQDEPPGVKVISHNASETTIEETFPDLPILGKAKCIYKECYSGNRVDFHMLESDKLKAFDGWWQLTPLGPNLTEVELATGVETGIKVPFARQMTNASTMRSITKQLKDVKLLAEKKLQSSI